tara:strand:- start:565 stop:1182 length:618 start_codon:yes stop_codon:yes gene_type:complete
MEVLEFFPSCVIVEKLNFKRDTLESNLDEFKEKGSKVQFSNVNGDQYNDYRNKDLSDAILEILPRKEGKEDLMNPYVYMWVNRNPKGASNSRHTHMTYNKPILLSGVYYVKVPENSGRIRFYDPRMISLVNPPDYDYYYDGAQYNFLNPQEDMIIMFPSWFEHDVEENKSDEERISIGFNIFVEGLKQFGEGQFSSREPFDRSFD